MQSMQNMQNMPDMQNMQNGQSLQYAQSMQNRADIQNMQNIQRMQNYNPVQPQTGQYPTPVQKNSNTPIPNNNTVQDEIEYFSSTKKKNNPDIRHLASDINKSLENYSPSNQSEPLSEDMDDDEDEDDLDNDDEDNNKSSGVLNFIPIKLKEPLLIIILYVILSQSFTKKIIGKYITYVNPKSNGNMTFVGVLIYGVILAILYMILSTLLLN